AVTRSFELVFVDDASPDGAWDVLTELAARHPEVRAFGLSRNFGQDAAITAGLSKSRGDWTVVIDCDLQEPPEEIPRLYAKANEGHDLVLARRQRRRGSCFRRTAAHAYFRLLSVFTGAKIAGEFGTFSILSRDVVNA